MTYLAALAAEQARTLREAAGQGRSTALPREAFVDLLTCSRCDGLVEVFQATHGARTPEEHKVIIPASYVCGACLEAGS